MENFSTGFLAPMLRQGGIFLAAAEGKTSPEELLAAADAMLYEQKKHKRATTPAVA